MSEKSMLSSKLLFYTITVSTLLFIVSSLFFLQRDESSSFTSSLVRKLMILPRTDIKNQDLGSIDTKCGRNRGVLKVFMYDLPSEFHFGILNWHSKGSEVWPNIKNISTVPSYPGGLNRQHSVEYWLTLDLLASETPEINRPCSAVRVKNSIEADIVFVPFFASLSYNRKSKLRGNETVSVDRLLQERLVEFLKNQDEWKRFDGKDHLIVAHHPNSLLYARNLLGSAMFVLSDFGRYPSAIANLEKDIIAPYLHVVKTVSNNDSAPFEKRPVLAYFQGAIYRKDGGSIRQELYNLLKDEKDVHFAFGTVRGNGTKQTGKGMASSKFCLNIAGDTPSSNRLFDAIVSHCVPVIISDQIELPFEDALDYSSFSVFVHSSEAVKKGFLVNLLRGIKKDQWKKKWERLKEVVECFEYRFPSRPGDSVNMIWSAVSHKLASLQFDVHRKNRYRRSDILDRNRSEI
ncbi:PREDICTED: probable arabinosyltransferase ARAD1 [Camelina sativa]|uniref:Probable arabinosyltransferase ARAD1 n=1 Tax=Camelina sativa TaxID=90675 RepID=A0ABM0WII2_CAMSA|nr:PREDICTED: probable arabinosyltransferase ARAD1 [Camelina sativa]